MKANLIGTLLIAMCGALMVTSCASSGGAGGASDSASALYYNGFESGIGSFVARGSNEKLEVVTDGAYAGSSCLRISDRAKSWQGASVKVSDVLEAGVQYLASAYVKADSACTITLSTDTTDSSGNRSYANLATVAVTGDGTWMEFSDVKFSVPADCQSFSLYFEGSNTATFYVDDFKIMNTQNYEIQDISGLKDVYADYFKVGTAVSVMEIASGTSRQFIKKHFNSITPGNALKPDSVLDHVETLANYKATGNNTAVKVSFKVADSILNFAAENDIQMRGHVLVWHQQTPIWFFKKGFDEEADWVDPDTMTARLENYIRAVMTGLAEQYPSVKFYSWDVVNEAASDAAQSGTRTPGTDTANGQSPWIQVYGDQSYITHAFEFARKYAPEGCKLYYNDYNEYVPAKRDYIVSSILKPLISKGLIDGVGMQSHLDIGYPDAVLYAEALDTYTNLGIDVQITELDVTVPDNSDATFQSQANYYSDLFDLYVSYADKLSAVVVWGNTDDLSWRAAKFPLLFNADFTAKPAYYAIVDGLE